jgi:uncharacterized protein (DUF4415 family)
MKRKSTAPTLTAADIARLNSLRLRPVAHDDDENPPLSATQLSKAVRHRGRPRGSRKARVTIRLDSDVVDWLKSKGSGYQTRINGILRSAMKRTSVQR